MKTYDIFFIISVVIPFSISIYLGFSHRQISKTIFWLFLGIIISYISYNYSNVLYWDYRMSLIDENSSIEDKMSATADGGKNAFGIILGWIPALFIILFFSKLIYLIKKIFNMFPYFNDEKLKNNNKKFSLKLKMANKSIHRTAE